MFQVNIMYTGDFGTDVDIFDLYIEPVEEIAGEYINIAINTELSGSGIAVYDVYFLFQMDGEMTLSVHFKDTYVLSQVYTDYYSWGEPDSTLVPITNINVGGYGLLEINSRAVFYANNTIWFSEFNKYNYIPNYNFVSLNLSDTDEIVKIKFFRTSYIIFTKEKIWKMEGTFGASDFAISLVSETVGCLAPRTVKVVGSKLIFVSNIGLKALVLDKFRANLENIEDVDLNIKDYSRMIPEYAEAFIYDDDYYLLTNQGDTTISKTNNGKIYNLPDVIVYKSQYGVYSFYDFAYDKYGHKLKLGYIYERYGSVYAINDEAFLKFDYGYNDSGYSYEATFETVSTNMGYPLHQKKVKDFIIKVVGGDVSQPLYVEMFANGAKVYSTNAVATYIDNDGAVIYTLESNIPSTYVEIGSSLIGSSVLGSSTNTLRKLRLPTKCKNVSVKVTTNEECSISVIAMGYTYKLGKIKE